MSSVDDPCRDGHGGPSRRGYLAALAAAALAPALPARAQIDWHAIDIWKPYRREDLGFEVELPGEPESEEEEDADGKTIHADFLFVGMMFGASHHEYKRAISVDDIARQQQQAARNLSGTITREAPFTVDGFPAIEIVIEAEQAFVSIMRAVVIGNRVIAIAVTGGPDIAANRSALRFLNSFRLLPGPRRNG